MIVQFPAKNKYIINHILNSWDRCISSKQTKKHYPNISDEQWTIFVQQAKKEYNEYAKHN